jgi:hypothetical protein
VLTVGGALAFAAWPAGLWLGDILDRDTGPLIIATIGAALATLHRHFSHGVGASAAPGTCW